MPLSFFFRSVLFSLSGQTSLHLTSVRGTHSPYFYDHDDGFPYLAFMLLGAMHLPVRRFRLLTIHHHYHSYSQFSNARDTDGFLEL